MQRCFQILRGLTLLVPLTAGMAPAPASAETVSLTCDLEITTHMPYGEPKVSRETAGVRMTHEPSNGLRMIVVDSLNANVTVGNVTGGSIISFLDQSTDDRWEIGNSERHGNNVIRETSVSIDRSNGLLMIYDSTRIGNNEMIVRAKGHCKKAPPERKF